MRKPLSLLAVCAAPMLMANAEATTELPPPIRAMLDAAIAAGNPSEVAIVEKYARGASPENAVAIKAIADTWRRDREAARTAQIRAAGPFELWSGNAQIGGYMTTGNTENVGVTAALNLTRESLRWRHKLIASADYQESLGLVSRERYLFAYEPNFKFSPRGYVYGAAQYESDRFLGYDDRFSTSVGAGYSAIKAPRTTLNLEVGPAFRYTSFTDSTYERSLAARGSLDFGWKLSDAVSLTQNASAYVQHYNSTVTGTTALNAKLIGPLAAKLSYSVQYESMPPIGRVGTDTTSRASLVYSF